MNKAKPSQKKLRNIVFLSLVGLLTIYSAYVFSLAIYYSKDNQELNNTAGVIRLFVYLFPIMFTPIVDLVAQFLKNPLH